LDCLIWAVITAQKVVWTGANGHLLIIGDSVIGSIDPGKHSRNFSCSRAATGPSSIPAYTASIDAAKGLVPEGCWAEGSLGTHDSARSALEIHAPMTFDPIGKGSAATAALALAAAALRARAASLTTTDGA
jgi:hypothetical protein